MIMIMIKVCGFVTFSERRSVFIKNLQLGLIYFTLKNRAV